MSLQSCPTCQIKKLDGVFRWSHNATIAKPEDVAGLVCVFAKGRPCINPCTDTRLGDTWLKRSQRLDSEIAEIAAIAPIDNIV